jgi:uncharacterized protein
MLSQGCVLCMEGAKMVLFVTGACGRSCWYCPLSAERKGTDQVYANDRPVTGDEDVIAEAGMMDALGTGVTGGEPLLVLDRVVRYTSLLKRTFGADHQIHLYTGVPPTESDLLAMQGLVDEIRLHPPQECWKEIMETPFLTSAVRAKELGFAIGVEVPALPGLEHLAPLLPSLDFMNINELEWGDTNANGMRDRGYELEDDLHNAILGSGDWASTICDDEKVHWCSSSFKDSVQLRERLKRIAVNTARDIDEVTPDGTVIYGVCEPNGDPGTIEACLEEGTFLWCEDHFEMVWWMLAELAPTLDARCSIVERYPNRGMIVEVTPL